MNGTIIPLGKRRRSVEEAIADFWSKVDGRPQEPKPHELKSPCCEWIGAKDEDGYGKFFVSELCTSAHRFSYFIHSWEWPAEGLVCHTCDNPPCISPYHLFLGTPKINTQDAVNKNRHAFGERNYWSKLTDENVRTIRSEFAPRVVTIRMLAQKYGVSMMCIQSVILRRTWRHVQ